MLVQEASLLITLPGQIKTLQTLSHPLLPCFPQSLLPTYTHASNQTTQACLLQVPFFCLRSLLTCTSLLTQTHPAFFQSFLARKALPCKSLQSSIPLFPLSPRQNPCCSLSAICLLHRRAIFYLSAMMTSKEVIPASSHLSFPQYKPEICEKARIVGKVCNVTALPEKWGKNQHRGWLWDLMKAFSTARNITWESLMNFWYIHHCMGALRQHWSVGHKERSNRCCGTGGWWYITKKVGMEKQILVLSEKLQSRKRNQHQHTWKKENTCAEVTAPVLWQSEAKTHPYLANSWQSPCYWQYPELHTAL